MKKDWWQTDSIQKLSYVTVKGVNIFSMFEIFLVSSRDTSQSQIGIQNQIFGILWISGHCKCQTMGLQSISSLKFWSPNFCGTFLIL